MKGGLSNGIRNTRRNGINKCLVNVAEAIHIGLGPCNCFFENGSLRSILHIVNVLIYLGRLNSLEVIPNGHVKNKAISISQTKLLGKNVADNPCLDILIKCLRNRQLRRPLAVISLVGCQNTGLVHTGRKLFAVHLLNRLQLKEASTGNIGRHNILCQLCIWTCCRTKWCLNLLVKNGTSRTGCFGKSAYSKNSLLGFVLA